MDKYVIYWCWRLYRSQYNSNNDDKNTKWFRDVDTWFSHQQFTTERNINFSITDVIWWRLFTMWRWQVYKCYICLRFSTVQCAQDTILKRQSRQTYFYYYSFYCSLPMYTEPSLRSPSVWLYNLYIVKEVGLNTRWLCRSRVHAHSKWSS